MADDLHSIAYQSIIRNLRAAREEAGVLQADLSVQLGKSENYVSRIETGQRRVGIVEIVLIARALKIEPVLFFKRIIQDV